MKKSTIGDLALIAVFTASGIVNGKVLSMQQKAKKLKKKNDECIRMIGDPDAEQYIIDKLVLEMAALGGNVPMLEREQIRNKLITKYIRGGRWD